MAKKPRVQKTKEQLVREIEVKRKRSIVVDKFYPALVNATVSIDEAKMLIQASTSLIMESVLETMKERKFSEIKEALIKKLCPNGDREKEVTELLNILEGENLFVAREIIEGMNRAIEQMVSDELKNRTLNSLNPDWGKMLN